MAPTPATSQWNWACALRRCRRRHHNGYCDHASKLTIRRPSPGPREVRARRRPRCRLIRGTTTDPDQPTQERFARSAHDPRRASRADRIDWIGGRKRPRIPNRRKTYRLRWPTRDCAAGSAEFPCVRREFDSPALVRTGPVSRRKWCLQSAGRSHSSSMRFSRRESLCPDNARTVRGSSPELSRWSLPHLLRLWSRVLMQLRIPRSRRWIRRTTGSTGRKAHRPRGFLGIGPIRVTFLHRRNISRHRAHPTFGTGGGRHRLRVAPDPLAPAEPAPVASVRSDCPRPACDGSGAIGG